MENREPIDTSIEEPIFFYPPEFYPLDNFSSFSVTLENGLTYPTSEHAYQASKFFLTDESIAEEIRNAKSAHEAKKIAHGHREKVRKNWDNEKLGVMEEILLCKVWQNPYVMKKLLQTGDRIIIENSKKDLFWGAGENGEGESHLGKLWMEIRRRIRTELEGKEVDQTTTNWAT
jgi:ribA/ribD-fused uncharacterized protein